MQDVLNLQEFWQCLGSNDCISLSLTCQLALIKSKQYAPAYYLIYLFGDKITEYLTTIDYTNLRACCQLTHSCLEQHPHVQVINECLQSFKDTIHSPLQQFKMRQLETMRIDFKQALLLESYFQVVPNSYSIIDLCCGRHKLDPGRRKYRMDEALFGVRFFIPTGQTLKARVIIGGLILNEYLISASDRDVILEDQFFNIPLLFANPVFGTYYHQVEIETNCIAELLLVKLRLPSQPLPAGEYRVLINMSKFRHTISPIRVIAGMMGFQVYF